MTAATPPNNRLVTLRPAAPLLPNEAGVVLAGGCAVAVAVAPLPSPGAPTPTTAVDSVPEGADLESVTKATEVEGLAVVVADALPDEVDLLLEEETPV